MGCFNMKCALTHLPVREGDPVVMLIGIQPDASNVGSPSGVLNQRHVFQLLTTPLFGEYNDYGWIQNITKDSMQAATLMLTAQGLGQAIKKGLKGDHWNDNLDAFTDALNSKKKVDDEFETATYTFIHRKAWDKLLAYGRDNMIDYRINDIKEADLVIAQERLGEFGIGGFEVNTYEERKLFACSGKPGQFFRASLALLPTLLKKVEPLSMPKLSKEMSGDDLDAEMTAFVAQMASYTDALKPNKLGSQLGKNFAWFAQMLSTEGTYSYAHPVAEKVLPVVQAAATSTTLAQILEDTQVIYQALLSNQIVVRPQDDLPSQSQDSTYWGHIAVVRAAAEVIFNRAEQYVAEEGLSELDGADPNIMVEQLAQLQLRAH